MGAMKESPRYHVASVRLSEEEKKAVDGLTAGEKRAALVGAAEGKGVQ